MYTVDDLEKMSISELRKLIKDIKTILVSKERKELYERLHKESLEKSKTSTMLRE
ncbi:MAG: hypothetical protein ACPLX8_00615 [Nanopusillaceae archaeon]